MIPSEVRDAIKAEFPDAVLTLSDLDQWGELVVELNGDSMMITVADTPEGWERAQRGALAWLKAIAGSEPLQSLERRHDDQP